MPKTLNISVVTTFFVLGLFSLVFSEDITITTYYPSPYGSYVELRANQMSVGSVYTGAALANGKLLVENQVGIGITNPLMLPFYRLEVGETSDANNYIRIRSSSTGWGGLLLYDGQGTQSGTIAYDHGSDAIIFETRNPGTGPAERMRIASSGDVGIGTPNPGGTLDVNGTIFQRGVVLHADYVFWPDYKLESIEAHAQYMWKYKHLKAIPKAKVDENGRQVVEIGANTRGILEELEKAHVYIQQLNERIKVLEAKAK